MENTVEKLTLDNLDKSTWKTYRFDQIAKNISERVEPTETNLEIYVGLEHIDSESIHIKRFGKREDVSGTKLRCYPGDVIFGRRRAYQRKAAIATFDGFCSAHSLVLRANSDVILPELFPFFLHSDTFMHRAVDISVGSLSPTINWGDLKKQEFHLPLKDQQSQIAELLWTGDEMIERKIDLLKKANKYITAYRESIFNDKSLPKLKLRDIFDVQLGKMLSAKARISANPSYYLANQNIQWGKINFDKLQRMDFNEREKEKFSLIPGDILVCEGGEVGRSAIWKGEIVDCYYQKALHRLRAKEYYIPEIMLEYMYWANSKDLFKGLTGHSTIAHLTAVELKRMSVPLFDKDAQRKISLKFHDLNKSIEQIENKIITVQSLQKSLINQFF